MNDNLSEMAFVLDRSGSMASMQAEAREGFNAFLSGQKKEPGQARFSLILFDHEYLVHCLHQDIREVQPLSNETYVPRGTNALYDAIGSTIDKLGQALDRTPEPDKPSRVLIAILTDGLENSSKDYSLERVNQMITHQRQTYSWQFIFLGAGLGIQATFKTSNSLGIPQTHAVAAHGGIQGMQMAMNATGQTCSAYRAQNNASDIQYTQNLAAAGQWGGAFQNLSFGGIVVPADSTDWDFTTGKPQVS